MNIPAFQDLALAFQHRFQVVPADTAALREECFRIRHTVYCEEFAFEPVRADGRETDEWDAHSIHCLLQSTTTEEYLGCIRLVVPPSSAPNLPLPFEHACVSAIDRSLVDPRRLPRDSIAEVSRLAVVPQFRRRRGEKSSPAAIAERAARATEHPAFPYHLAGLYLGMLALARRHGIDTLFMLVEPRLARQLAILGVRPQIIGNPVEHRGKRVPIKVCVPSVLDGLSFVMRPLFDAIWTNVGGATPASRRRTPAPVLARHDSVGAMALSPAAA